MKKFALLFSVLFLLLSINAHSQNFPIGKYFLTNTTSPYGALVGDSTVTLIGGFDTGLSDAINITFPFRFGNLFPTQFKVTSNGWLTFNIATVTVPGNPLFSSFTSQIIAPFAADLISANPNNPAKVSILRDGTAPNRILKIQWQNFSYNNINTVLAIASFQVWIYETSNIIESRYGSFVVGTNATNTSSAFIQVGLKSSLGGGGAASVDSLTSTKGTTWSTAAKTIVSNENGSMIINPSVLPDSNRLYRWTPIQHRAFDVTPTVIDSPLGVLANCPVRCFRPTASIKNIGTAFAAFNATYQITGPGVPYTSTRSGSLSAGAFQTLTFDSTFCPSVAGTWVLKVFTTFPSDSNSANDTLTLSLIVVNPGAGGGLPANCNYFFANNLACSVAPNKPVFFWEDTTGSSSLIIDTSVQTPPGVFVGNKNDGYWKLAIPGLDQFRFCGVAYDSFFVSINGMIGLTLANNNSSKLLSASPTDIPSTLALQPGLFPLWKDFGFNAVTGSKRISYRTMITASEGLVLLITYDRAPDNDGSLTDFASFQIILQLGPGGGTTDGRIIYQYDDSRTGAGFLNDYFNFTNLLDEHTVGIQDVTGTRGIQYRRLSFPSAMANVITPGPLFGSPLAVAFGPDQQILPVELASFTSTVNRRDVTLNWTTAREFNNSGFEVERAAVNGEWSKVGFVQGSGNSSSSADYTFSDNGLNTGKYNYRLKQIDFNGNYEYFNLGNEVVIGIPAKYDLAQNYPNPFNPTTNINYDIPFDGKVTLKIFDISGREVSTLINEFKTASYYTIDFNASNLASGVYFYRISAEGNGNNFVMTKKMMLIK